MTVRKRKNRSKRKHSRMETVMMMQMSAINRQRNNHKLVIRRKNKLRKAMLREAMTRMEMRVQPKPRQYTMG